MPRAAHPTNKKSPEAALKVASDLKGLKGIRHPVYFITVLQQLRCDFHLSIITGGVTCAILTQTFAM
jgi:hypothetical protein